MASEQQLSVVLSEFALTMVTDFPIQGILERLVGRIVGMLPISAAGVTLISPGSDPRYVAASDESALRYEKLQTELDEGPCLAAYRTGEAVAVPDLATDERFKIFGPRAVAAGLAAVFTFPLRQGDKRLGALDLYRQTPGQLDDDDMAAAQTLADVTAAYLVNAQGRDELRNASERAYENSVHDALTGLPNRTLLLERVGHALRRRNRSRRVIAVMFADLDDFKTVNDLHGHRAGDALLVAVAERITTRLRPSDTLARVSGDEFVILCEDLDDHGEAEAIATRVADAFTLPFDLSGIELEISASVGIAFAGDGEQSPEQLLEDADVAMYQAKRKGGGQHQLIDLRERRLQDDRASLRRDLRLAVPRGELRAEYQPIVRTDDGRVVGVEALLRWEHPTQGSIAPAIAMPLAEQAGFMTEIGRWMLEQACADRHRWAGDGAPNFGMAVNVSPYQLMAQEFVSTVADVLDRTDTPPETITLEISESVFINDSVRALIVLDDLKTLGVLLALDDFGTGYSSLSYLNQFPVDAIKIDQAFTAKLCRDPITHAIVEKTTELAHMLELAVVVEGVETAGQLHEISALGADYCQGFYFAHPMDADKLDQLMIKGGTSSNPSPLLGDRPALKNSGTSSARCW
ncbi:MAG: putative bifunctional diguanylate cyclase/phosphodiesterase [Acidimicrobiales bacterium]